ncbi:MAG TPA: glycosyltransferase family 2 protein [Candidatus Solibacter sp.]|jgi:glycosyltransferase involved in cell wall biosynthesis|nr:glycosyltransferase family 2 protein [Candidatus Solibacter sp.]
MRLSVLMPAYNEAATVERTLAAVLATPQEKEIILVDDGSTDGTVEIIRRLGEEHPDIKVLVHERNQGKGAAVRTALAAATGDVVLIQDCDLEYNPDDYGRLLEPIVRGEADVVFGTRSFSSHTSFSFWFVMGNKMVTLATNILFNCYISDMETCYKVMRIEAARKLKLTARGFELEPQITGGLLNLGYQIYEVPVDYKARTREQGKKLTWTDGLRAIQTLCMVRLQRNRDRRRANLA